MGFSRQEYWSGWPFPPPRDLLDPGIKPTSATAPALQADSLLPSRWGSSLSHSLLNKFCRFHLHLNVSRYCTFLPCYIKYFWLPLWLLRSLPSVSECLSWKTTSLPIPLLTTYHTFLLKYLSLALCYVFIVYPLKYMLHEISKFVLFNAEYSSLRIVPGTKTGAQ